MKGVTIHQPFATAIALGAKRIETRSWRTNYRGPIAIHAGKRRRIRELREMQGQPHWQAALSRYFDFTEDLPFGAFVATAYLQLCIPVEKVDPSMLVEIRHSPTGRPWDERDLGNYSPGRYCWILDNVLPLPEPIPHRGQQGLWTVAEGVLDV